MRSATRNRNIIITTVTAPPVTDNAGHTFDPALYRVDASGQPIYTKAGTFRLKPGKSHIQ
jgi:hypothetical protein